MGRPFKTQELIKTRRQLSRSLRYPDAEPFSRVWDMLVFEMDQAMPTDKLSLANCKLMLLLITNILNAKTDAQRQDLQRVFEYMLNFEVRHREGLVRTFSRAGEGATQTPMEDDNG